MSSMIDFKTKPTSLILAHWERLSQRFRNLRHFTTDWADPNVKLISAVRTHISPRYRGPYGVNAGNLLLDFSQLQNHLCAFSPVILFSCDRSSRSRVSNSQRAISLKHKPLICPQISRQVKVRRGKHWRRRLRMEKMNSHTAPDCQTPLRVSNLHNLNDLNTSGQLV